jgi:GNAT superfamily N-acetyltransferase
MKLLRPDYYGKVAGPLDKVLFNTLFARMVVERHIPGTVHVDDTDKPGTFLVKHPYGMSLLFGDSRNEGFNTALKDYMIDAASRKGHEWLQVHPNGWKLVVESQLGPGLIKKNTSQDKPAKTSDVPGKVIEYSRVNFRFNETLYRGHATQLKKTPHAIVRTTENMVNDMSGQVIPRYFWWDGENFGRGGIGFSMVIDGQAASTAFVAFTRGRQLEMGIETAEKYRGKGYARYACMALIDYCLANGYEPIWSCRLENTGSFKLALNLGFEPTLYLPYYQLVSHP